ncbi:MAG: peptide deformylase [Gammaproteobacteria bacterium 39-13]|nr:peptide deformylase [Gammaproteobacteria bacterium]OJV93072.1 MAG: peptide deformylase [Gammaproteobacteria bacterium 39-13]
MSIKNIIVAGTPQLRQPAKIVPLTWFGTLEAQQLIEELFATMQARQGVGLAAPQINVPLRVLVYGFEMNARYPDQAPVPRTLMVNPKIIHASEEKVYLYEGCLSLPEIRGLVPRHEWIEVEAQDKQGKIFQNRYQGFEARIIQHEIDHLEGKLYPERMDNMRTLGVTAALREAGLIR